MILHTPVPYSEIFPEEPRKLPSRTELPSGYIDTEDDKILDVFSTDPNDYLKFAPGFPTGGAPGFPTGQKKQ